MDPSTLPSTEDDAVRFLQEKGIFPKQRKCSSEHDMNLCSTHNVGLHWRCRKKSCGKQRISIRDGTWFSRSSISLVKALRFLYAWSVDEISTKWCKEELGMSKTTTVDWKRCIVNVVTKYLDRRKIGGVGQTVELEETVVHNLKTVYGREPRPQYMIAGVCRETRQCFLKVTEGPNPTVFVDSIRENVAEGSTICCESWKEYNAMTMGAAGFQRLKATHRLNFVDPADEEDTKTIEELWNVLKWRNKRQKGSARQSLDSYLGEFIWRYEPFTNASSPALPGSSSAPDVSDSSGESKPAVTTADHINDTHPFEALLEAMKSYSNNDQNKSKQNDMTPTIEEDRNSRHDEVHGCRYEITPPPATVTQQQATVVRNLPELCPACDTRLKNLTDLAKHAGEVHEFDGTVKQEVFSSYTAFERWKEEMEEKHNTHWVRRRWRTLQKMFYCQLRCPGPRPAMNRRLDTSSIQGSCTSFINVTRQLMTGVTSVEYCVEHFGHEKKTRKPRLPWSLKLKIAEKLKQGLPVINVVRFLQQENGGSLKRHYSVTVHDVISVVTKLKANPKLFETGESTTSPDISESDRAESPMYVEFCKEEPCSAASTSAAEPSVRRESTQSTRSASPDVLFKTEHDGSAEYSMCGTSIKEEPIPAATLLAESSTGRVEVKPPGDDGVRMFTLTAVPDGKGFALVDQSLV